MDASPVKLIDYFQKKRQYVIPLFQRPYIWKKENWEMLWKDILNYYASDASITETAPHFMGAIVSIPVKSMPVGVDKDLIIDGQQRLTTVSILLCALRDIDAAIAEEIQDLLVNRHQKDTPDYLKIMPTQGDRNVYKTLIQRKFGSLTSDEKSHLICKCYDFFKKELLSETEEGEKIDPKIIFNVIQSVFQVVMINLTSTDDPYLIFESLNFKGEKLTQVDLIRNLILMKFKHSAEDGGEQQKIYEDFWIPLENGLGDKTEDFFFHYIRMRNATVSNVSRIYSDMKQILADSSRIEDSLDDVQMNAMYYKRFLNPRSEPNSKIRHEMEVLNRMKSMVLYPILLRINAFREKGLDDATYLRILQTLNSFIIRRTTCRWKTNIPNSSVVRLLKTFPQNDDITHLDQWLTKELMQQQKLARWPNDEEFRDAIVSGVEQNRNFQVLFLEEIERSLAGKEIVDLRDVGISLEHIMPQTLSEIWKADLGENYEEVHSKYLWNFGNLTLTGYNSELSNSPFSDKRNQENGYAHSGFKMNLEIAQNEKWGAEEILARANRLADIAIKIWQYPAKTKEFITLEDSWTFKIPQCLYIYSERHFVSTWKDLAKRILVYFKTKDEDFFEKELASGNIVRVEPVATGFQANLNLSAEDIRKAILKWCTLFSTDISVIKIEIL